MGSTTRRDAGKSFARLPGVSEIHAFGFGKAAPGADHPGALPGRHRARACAASSARTTPAATWVRINDDQHQWGLVLHITGDPEASTAASTSARTGAARCTATPREGVSMRPNLPRTLAAAVLAALAATLMCGAPAHAQAAEKPLPQLVQKDGRHALLVDGAPFLILGVQCHNSSAWPAMLPKVWPAVEDLHANTLEMPVYWEQFEPEPGRFDTSVVDTLISRRASTTCGWSCSGSARGRTAAPTTCRCG